MEGVETEVEATLKQLYISERGRLIRQFESQLWRELGDRRSIAEDLFQVVFELAWKSRAQYDARRDATVATWLHVIARNAFFDYCRKQIVRRSIHHVSLDVIDHEEQLQFVAPANQKETISSEELLSQFRRALGSCPVYYFPAFVLRYVEDDSLEEIAAKLGIRSTNTIKVALNRARNKIRKNLSRVATKSLST